jgi:putative tricarboxylic transport membrane protein
MRSRPGETLFGVALLSLGLFAIYEASALPFGSVSSPDAGLFPVSIAVALTVFAALSLAAPSTAAAGSGERAGIVRVCVLIAAIACYAILLPRAGFIVCTLVLLGVVLRGLGRVGWLATIVGTSAGTLACYVLFTRLGMPLPAGLFGF